MEKEKIDLILEKQKRYFSSGATNNINFRLDNLKKLRMLIVRYDREIIDALWTDFHKPAGEVISSEIQLVMTELNYAIRNLRRWARPKRVGTPLVHIIARSYISPQPYGQVLILSPWNFPFQLAMVPVIGALAAGNCVVLKASQQVPAIAGVMEKITGNFPDELITMVRGDHSVSEYLLNYKFNYIFFTGSPETGRYVMSKAAVNLTPISLELGGKSPCVIAADARLDFAARRVAWGKFYNAGQTCVCPDYVLIDKRIKDRFLDLISHEIKSFYGENPEMSNDLPRVISSRAASRLASYMLAGKIVCGGITDPANRYVAPTVIKDIAPDDPVMKEEVFGPVLPVIEFSDIEEAYEIIDRNPEPLSAYLFTRNSNLARRFLTRVKCGSAAINDTVIQFATPYLPFGGVGRSGMGRYHGKKTFETFSNTRGIMVKSNLIDLVLRYPPYTRLKEKAFRFFMR